MHTESDRRHLPSVIERFVLRGGIRTTFPPGSFGQTSEQINSVEAFLSPAEATPRETLGEKDDAGSNSTKGVKKGVRRRAARSSYSLGLTQRQAEDYITEDLKAAPLTGVVV